MSLRLSVLAHRRTLPSLVWLAVVAVALLLLGPGAARAGFRCQRPCSSVTFAGCNGLQSAAVTFTPCDSDLIITLTNTSPEDVLDSDGVLSGVSFELQGSPTLGLRSADVPTGHETWFGGGSVGTPGASWTYGNMPGGGGQGIRGGGSGITSAGDNPFTGTPAVTGDWPLFHSSTVFTLTGLPPGFDVLTATSNVRFHYGDSSGGPTLDGELIHANPEPMSLVLLGAGMAGLAVYRTLGRRGRVSAPRANGLARSSAATNH